MFGSARDFERVDETVAQVEPDRAAVGDDALAAFLVDEAANLGQAPAQFAARIVGGVPQQLADLGAGDGAGRQDEVAEKRAHLARGGQGQLLVSPRQHQPAEEAESQRFHGLFHARYHAASLVWRSR
jgi:hypothetical protein